MDEFLLRAYIKKLGKLVDVTSISMRNCWIEYFDSETQQHVKYQSEDISKTEDINSANDIVFMNGVQMNVSGTLRPIYSGDIV